MGKSDFRILINVEKDDVNYIKSSLQVYNELSPDAYYVYLNLINSRISFSPSVRYFGGILRSERKARYAIKELQDKGLLDIRPMGYRSYSWSIKYTFDKRDKPMFEPEIKHIIDNKREKIAKEKDEIMKFIELNEKKLDSLYGKEYEQVQEEIIELRKKL